MKAEEMQQKLQAFMGWKITDTHVITPDGKSYHLLDGGERQIPNFTGDLNAIAEVVASLTEDQRHAYAIFLAGAQWKPAMSRGWVNWMDTLAVSEATAPQRSAALIRALKL
jgi:hypothetical protein